MSDHLQPLADLLAPLVQPIVAEAVAQTLAQIEADEARLGDRLAYPEPEAAALLGIQPHILRDCRRRGEIEAVLCGKRFLYPRAELLRYLRGGRPR